MRFFPILRLSDLIPLCPGSLGEQKVQSTTSKAFVGILVSEMEHEIITARREHYHMASGLKVVDSIEANGRNCKKNRELLGGTHILNICTSESTTGTSAAQ